MRGRRYQEAACSTEQETGRQSGSVPFLLTQKAKTLVRSADQRGGMESTQRTLLEEGSDAAPAPPGAVPRRRGAYQEAIVRATWRL